MLSLVCSVFGWVADRRVFPWLFKFILSSQGETSKQGYNEAAKRDYLLKGGKALCSRKKKIKETKTSNFSRNNFIRDRNQSESKILKENMLKSKVIFYRKAFKI